MKQPSMLKKTIAVAVCAAVTTAAVPAGANSLTAFVTVPRTDFAWFGYGGMRSAGTGSITVSGVSGTVTYALLVWQGPSNDTTNDAANAAVTFNGTPITGTNIGNSSPNCWSFANSRAYQANVTSLVSGNGTYSLANFIKTATPVSDINGVSLLVFYDDGNSANNRDYAIFLGNDSNRANSYDPLGWGATLNNITYTSGSAAMRLIVADGQSFGDPGFAINGTTVVPAGNNWQGAGGGLNGVVNGPVDNSGGLWDHSVADITARLTPGSNNLVLTDVNDPDNDCLSLIGAIFDLPAGAAPPGPPPPTPVVTAPQQIPTLSEWAVMLLALLTGGAAALNLRRRRR
jgi:hypothetical protein